MPNYLPYKDQAVITLCEQMNTSYHALTNEYLVDGDLTGEPLARALYEMPEPLLMHGTQEDPIFCFANNAAQKQWDLGWNELTTMPSRESAPEDVRAERQQLLDAANNRNIVLDYQGVRVSSKGKQFQITDTVLWNVQDKQGNAVGQAAVIGRIQQIEQDSIVVVTNSRMTAVREL